MSRLEELSVIIVGAGIGGLVTALHLHAHGITNVHLFDSSSTLSPLGVGINVQPSAVLVLRNLGLLPALLSTGIRTHELNFYDTHGNSILQEPRGSHAGYKVPQISIHRGEFQMLLLDTVKERLGEENIHLDHCFQSFSQTEPGSDVTVKFVRRRDESKPPAVPEMTANLMIAADGINSSVRKVFYPNEGPPRWSGKMLYRACLEREPFLTGASMVWAGHATQLFIAYPISSRLQRQGRALVNWIVDVRVQDEGDPNTTPPLKSDWTKTIDKAVFSSIFDKWTFGFLDIRKLIEDTDKVYEFPMCDRDAVDQWSFHRVTLLGDAAHAMLPIGSNGASQAILDAECLVGHLAANPGVNGVPKALKAYETERIPPTAKIVQANRGHGPDHILQMVHERAPNGFADVYDVVPKEELEAVGATYKRIAGFDLETVNRKAEQTEGRAESLGLKPPKTWVDCD